MEIQLRIILVLGALVTLLYFLAQIRKSRLQIDFAIFWSLFAGLLLLLGLFPQVVVWISSLFQFESPANMVFLGVIFVLMLKLFTNTLKLSRMNRQIVRMAQHLALLEKEREAANQEQNPETGQGSFEKNSETKAQSD